MSQKDYRGAAYLDASASGATQVELLLIVYDAIIAALHQAAAATEAHDIARRCERTNRIMVLLGHLENWATQLDDTVLANGLVVWYQFLRAQLLQLQASGTSMAFDQLAALVCEVRTTWKEKEMLMQSRRALDKSAPQQQGLSPFLSWSA